MTTHTHTHTKRERERERETREQRDVYLPGFFIKSKDIGSMSRSSISLEGLEFRVPVGVADRDASGEVVAEGGGRVEKEGEREMPGVKREELAVECWGRE